MNITIVVLLLAAATMVLLAVVMSSILGWANKAFHVEVDPRVEKLIDVLPGANCGGCGYIGCAEYAEALATDPQNIPVTLCAPGGASCAAQVAEILGVTVEQSWPYRAVVHCAAKSSQRKGLSEYQGEMTCAAANLVAGFQGCTYGCLGLGDCVTSCDFDAIHIIEGLATVDYDKCVGCGACVTACPRNIISRVPFKAERMLVVACSNKDSGPDTKKVCEVGCIGCRACARITEIFQITDGLASIDYDQYEPQQQAEELDAALNKCPMEAMTFVGKPSEKDLAAVADEHLPDRITDHFKTTVDETEWRG